MNTDVVNALGLAACLAAASWGALQDATVVVPPPPPEPTTAPTSTHTDVTDARGKPVPIAPYARIVSLNTVSDHILLELVEPGRLVSITGLTRDTHPRAWRFGERVSVGRSDQLEAIVALQPDLVVVSQFADEAFMARLRESGIRVFDLGPMEGVRTTRANITTLGHLLDIPDRAAALSRRFERELAGLASRVPEAAHEKGLYLTVYGDTLYGGTTGSSYADMLHYGGVHDVAADFGHTGWPQYTPEAVLAMDPPLIITGSAMRTALCSHSTLRQLKACAPGGRIVELDAASQADPGLGIVDSAEAVLAAVHGDRGE